MRYTFTHCFEELELIKSQSIYAAGEAEVSYRIFPAEPDVGYFEKYIGDIDIEGVGIFDTKDSKILHKLDRDHPLYKFVMDALERDDYLDQACHDDANDRF